MSDELVLTHEEVVAIKVWDDAWDNLTQEEWAARIRHQESCDACIEYTKQLDRKLRAIFNIEEES